MDRSKIVAIITGAIALLLGVAYLAVVQFLDFRGEMLPAPIDLPALIQPVAHHLEYNVKPDGFEIQPIQGSVSIVPG
ncbi:MAG: hypothetical protein AAFQ57_02665 [Cyanobacteria bacterium J06626_14]